VIAASAGRRVSAVQLLGWGVVAFGGVDLGIIPVLAVQGGGYVVAGFAMLLVLRESPGRAVVARPGCVGGGNADAFG